MHPEHDPSLTPTHLAVAEADLAAAEAIDLATASNAVLVSLVETLRGTLSDVLRIARTCTGCECSCRGQ